jgi:hypothetical protein
MRCTSGTNIYTFRDRPMSDRDIFSAALETDQRAERVVYLDEACAGNPELRERVETLLAAHAAVSGRPNATPREPVSTRQLSVARVSEPSGLPPRPEGSGTRIGPYKLLPIGHEYVGRSLLLLGRIHVEKDRPKDAEPELREALALFREQYSMKYELIADTTEWLGACLLSSDRYSEAEPLLGECVTIRAKNFPEIWTTYSAKALLGASLLAQKRYAEAEPQLLAGHQGLKTRAQSVSLQGRARMSLTAEQLAQLYDATGKSDKAEAWRTTARELQAAGQEP